MSNTINIERINRGIVLYPEDTIVREAGVNAIRAIVEKVSDTAIKANNLQPASFDEPDDEYNARHLAAVREALSYALDALRGIDTALSLGRGGYVGADDRTNLSFYGVMLGAVIDRDTSFSAHT